jgi:hypothetical protein
MLTSTALVYAGGIAAITFVSSVWTKYKMAKRARREGVLPLFDLVQLEIATTPHADETSDVLTEIRETLQHLNRRRFAEEVWGLDEQLATYYSRLPDALQPTMHGVLLRFIQSNDRWLQIVGAKTSATLNLRENRPVIDALLQKTSEPALDESSKRFRTELEAALKRLA